MADDTTLIFETAGPLLAVLAFLYQRQRDKRADQERRDKEKKETWDAQQELVRRVERIEQSDAVADYKEDKKATEIFRAQFNELKVQHELVWRVLSVDLPKSLRSPHRQTFDKLQEIWESVGPKGMTYEQLIAYRDSILALSEQRDDSDWALFKLIAQPVNAEIVERDLKKSSQ